MLTSPKVYQVVNGITVYTLCDVLEFLYPGYYENQICLTLSYADSTVKVVEWALDNDCSLYEDGREDFSINKGFGLRRKRVTLGSSSRI
jgi:hypothetical protein